jgi:hypothetical protein
VTSQTAEWLTIREASLALGVSELTIRRRIKGGRMANRVVAGKYYVNLSAEPDQRPASPKSPPPSSHSNDSVRSAEAETQDAFHLPPQSILAEYAKLAERAGRASALEDQIRRLEEQRTKLEQSVVTLAGRNGWLESRLEEREVEIKLLTDSRRRPGFLRRLFGSDR